MPEPESCAQAAQPKGRPSAAAAYTDNHLPALESTVCHWRYCLIWPGVLGLVVGAGDKRSDRSDGLVFGGGRKSCVCCWLNDWLELDDRIACCSTHTHKHTHTHTPHRRTTPEVQA